MTRTRAIVALLVNTAIIVGGALVLSASAANASNRMLCEDDETCVSGQWCQVASTQRCCPFAPGGCTNG